MWTFAKQTGIPTCEEDITFGGTSESWPVFCIEMAGILTKYGPLQLLSFASVGGLGITPSPHIYFHSAGLGAVLNMAVNNLSLMWLIHESNIYGIRLCYWIKVRYGSADELDTLKCFYG